MGCKCLLRSLTMTRPLATATISTCPRQAQASPKANKAMMVRAVHSGRGWGGVSWMLSEAGRKSRASGEAAVGLSLKRRAQAR
jgi:hypothetical protein